MRISIAFTSVEGFLNYNAFGPLYVECSDGSTDTDGTCPDGTTITGPVALYLQQAGVGGLSVDEAGTQEIIQNEFALFIQDSWQPQSNLTVNYGLRWEAQLDVRAGAHVVSLRTVGSVGHRLVRSATLRGQSAKSVCSWIDRTRRNPTNPTAMF